jgi:hypothetical protein
MFVLFIVLLHGLVWPLLHERIAFKAYCSSDLDEGKPNFFKREFDVACSLTSDACREEREYNFKEISH